jgi:hypothetical protein
MKKLMAGLLLGLAAGYTVGYQDAESGRATVAARALDRFGVSKVKSAQEARERRQDEAIKN